ncbi:MAG: hypothetical protein J6Z11_03190 [Candidatus Riflebacteria bacterium]|nr:hypothetical protein [Candidatus Riflebacteria bacterium]
MRQTSIFRLCNSIKPIMLCTMLLFFSCLASTLHADLPVSNIQVDTTLTGPVMNGGGTITLRPVWQGDSTPFTVNFLSNGSIIRSISTSNTNIPSTSFQASQFQPSTSQQRITVQVTDFANRTVSQDSDPFIYDNTPPTLTTKQFTTGNNGNFGPNDLIQLQLITNKNVLVPEVSCEGTSLTTTTAAGANNYVFQMQLNGNFANGTTHRITIKLKDTTEPSASANSSDDSIDFTVGNVVSGQITIESATPSSPTNQTVVTLSGSCPTGTAKVAILDGSSEVVPPTVFSGNSWSLNVPVTEKTYSFIAVAYDQYDQEISRSQATTYIVDQQAPSVPTYDASTIPTQTNLPQQSFTITVDGYETEPSTPVYLLVYKNGTELPNKYNITTQGSPITIQIPLDEGPNVISFKTRDGANNLSASSESITITKSGSSETINVATVMVDTYSVPAPASTMLGPGAHTLVFNFNQAVSDTIPTVEVNCGGGSKITATNVAWNSNTSLTATFNIPNNGGAAIDGSAGITLKGAKDTFGNTVADYVQDGAFSIDSTPPTSTITNTSPIYISTSNPSINLTGTVQDNDGGSGVKLLTLYTVDPTGASTSIQIPLMPTPNQSPWSYPYSGTNLTDGFEYTLLTAATDDANPDSNSENPVGKTGIKLIVDNTAPAIERISFNNTGVDFADGTTIASDITRLVLVASDTGSGLNLSSTDFIFNLTAPNGELINGEKSNNGINTIYFDFPVLTASGTYTVTVTPIDNAGNKGTTTTKTFILNRDTPDSAEFNPPNQSVANKSDTSLAENEVRVILSTANGAATPSYPSSTISVKYNGLEVGTKVATETEALVAKLHDGNLKTDGSHDGNYYITVIPHSTTGLTGNAINSSFIYDTQPPVVTSSEPSINDTEVWFGKNLQQLSITVSDAPKDILEHYKGQLASIPEMPGDTTWYNGSGSGINYNVSTFTWTMGDQVSTNHSRNGNTMSVECPKVPEDKTAGVSDVQVTITLGDNVNRGAEGQIPNTNTITRTYKFDYVEPTIKIATSNGAKYCKNLLTVKASAEDEGTDDNLQVTKIEYNDENGGWQEMSVKVLPSKNASFTLELDITNKKEGTHTIKFRAVDRGGNTSQEKEFSYVIDRTPPSAPGLTIPLADYTVNKRSQNFKWVTSNGADSYLIQISDDSSFNNILNNQPTTKYPSLTGTVYTTTEAAFSLPKDGTFYWRVAAIEDCEDGYNISEFSETRKIIIDTVKPYIVSVAPSPSSSNIVSTGMVTFTIRFSETLDSTKDLTAILTSAGGQVMKIEKISCTGDTWTGTTVIPKNNSALYDGTATIAVEGASDIAGNVMQTDSSNTIVVNTGPAFTTKLFSNPANEYEITIITKSTESLQSAPSVTVTQNAEKTTVAMNFLKDRFYSGSYKIDKENPGSAYIKISGTDLYGMVGNSTVEFVIADVNASSRLNVSASSGRATLKAAEGATYSPTAVYIIDRATLESPFSTNTTETTTATIRASAGVRTSVSSNKKSELIGILGLDEIGPSSTKLKKCMLYTADVNGEVFDTSKADKIHIYRQDAKGNWIFQGGQLKDYKISAQITGLGRLALMADTTAPKMSSMSPTNQAKLDTNFPEIKGQFEDNGSGLVIDSFRLYIDDLQVKNVEMNKDGSFKYQVKQVLKKGKHEIKCEVKDKAGNTLVRAVTVDAPEELRIGEFSPYPSPARGNHINFAYNFGARPDRASLKVYDSAGHIVAKFGNDDFDRARGSIRWDLTNLKGKRISNGAYIYKLEVSANGQKFKKRGKLAVLR